MLHVICSVKFMYQLFIQLMHFEQVNTKKNNRDKILMICLRLDPICPRCGLNHGTSDLFDFDGALFFALKWPHYHDYI